jgi:hypothetical protein
MEILRFEEAPTSAPKRKKSSRSFMALGFVATLFGVSTAFASSTITINNPENTIALGQGVSVFTTCDTEIGVEPVTTLDATNASQFGLTKVIIGSTKFNDDDEYLINNNNSPGCLGTDFAVKFYDSTLSGELKTTPINVCTGYGFSRVSHTVAGTPPTTSASTYICKDSTIYFQVLKSSHSIEFTGSASTDFFDRISLETTTVSSYTP